MVKANAEVAKKPGANQVNTIKEHVEDAKDTASDAAHSDWAEMLARLGFATKGVLYLLVGILAALAAFGRGGKTTTTRGAIETISEQSFGYFLLILITIGLIGYVLWRFADAIFDLDHKGTDASGLLQRAGYVASGIAYAGLALATIQLLLGRANPNSQPTPEKDYTAWLMSHPLGIWVVVIAGLIVIGVGISFFYTAYTAKFKKRFDYGEMSETAKEWAVRFGQFGLTARGVVFFMIGLFLINAAWDANPQEAGGLDEALQRLAQEPFGPYLLGIMAFGLIAYGIYSLFNARYRKINEG